MSQLIEHLREEKVEATLFQRDSRENQSAHPREFFNKELKERPVASCWRLIYQVVLYLFFLIFWPFLLDQVSSSCSPKLGSLCVALRLERPVGRFRRRRSPRTTTEDSGAKVQKKFRIGSGSTK